MAKEFTDDDDALLADLGIEVETNSAATRTPREERIIAGFEEIQRFVEEHGRSPQHGADGDIFERLYALRLNRIREQDECRTLLASLDHQGLLSGAPSALSVEPDALDDDALLAELGIEAEAPSITELQYVRSSAEKKAAEEIANRQKCEDFETFRPLFEQVQRELDQGIRVTRLIRKDAGFLKTDIKEGQFFILGGQTLYVAEIGEPFKAPNGQMDARMRVIYSNGTESDLLLRSLQRAIYKEEASRMISEPGAGPLFSDEADEDDVTSGTIYVLRSKSTDQAIAEKREVLHKIGVTGGTVGRRIANAKTDATFLLADVEVVATYRLVGINRVKLENLIHRVFGPARLEIEIIDRFGKPFIPREWFLVPLFVIDEAVERIKDGTIAHYTYDTENAELVADAAVSPSRLSEERDG